MKKLRYILIFALSLLMFQGCIDDDSFTTSPNCILTFGKDTVRMDTVFSKIPTSRRSFWIYNRSSDGIRCKSVRLENGNTSGFRVNVSGRYLSKEEGYQISDVEIRKGDSVFVQVELTSPVNHKIGPQLMEDNIAFRLESGVEQKVNLNAYSWDAEIVRNLHICSDTLIKSDRPIVVYGNMRIDSLTTTTISPGTTLYFHANSGLDVYGRLIARGMPGKNIIFRGDRTDRMFDYLPYDQVSGQWNGIRFHSSSFENEISYADIHSAFDGIVCDSSDVSRLKLKFYNSILHNCQGYGLKTVSSVVDIQNSQITNVLHDCLAVYGGAVSIYYSTIAQFYPFDSNAGVALRFTNSHNGYDIPLYQMDCINSIITGMYDDVIMGEVKDSTVAYTYKFVNSILRTPKVETTESQSERFKDVVWEDITDTAAVTGEKHFKHINRNRQSFDFHITELSPAVNAANVTEYLPLTTDRDGMPRDERPDIGCYEYRKEETN